MRSINNKGALELSIGTIVILVLGMSMLILGLVLVRTIFTGAQYNVDQINKNVEAEINKLFDETSGRSIAIYLPNSEAEIKKGDSFGVAFGIKNDVQGESEASQFVYNVKAVSIQEGCRGLDVTTADKYVILRRTGTFSMLPGAKPYLNTIKIQPPESAPLCEIGYELQVQRDNQPYGIAPFTVVIK